MTLASGFAPKNDKDLTIAALIGTLVSAALAIVVLSSALWSARIRPSKLYPSRRPMARKAH